MDALLNKEPIHVLYLPSSVDKSYGRAKDWADHQMPNQTPLDAYDSLDFREKAEHIAALMGLECVTVSGDGKNTNYVSELRSETRCVILEPTRLWDNDTRGWVTNICQRLRGRVVIARSKCADIELRSTADGFEVIAHPSPRFKLTHIYDEVDHVEYKSQ